jgi:hypothetical protein
MVFAPEKIEGRARTCRHECKHGLNKSSHTRGLDCGTDYVPTFNYLFSRCRTESGQVVTIDWRMEAYKRSLPGISVASCLK